MSRSAIIDDMAKLANGAVGNFSEFLSGFEDWKTDMAARTSFKASYFTRCLFSLPDCCSHVALHVFSSAVWVYKRGRWRTVLLC